MGWIIGLPEDKLARWFYFYNHDPIGWFFTPTWWLWKSVFGCNGCKKPTRAFGGWFFTPAWWLEISALFHHGFKKPPRAQGGSFFHFSLVRKMGIFLNRLVKPFWKYIVRERAPLESTFIKLNGSSAGYPSGVPRTRIGKLFLISKSASYRSKQFKFFSCDFSCGFANFVSKTWQY